MMAPRVFRHHRKQGGESPPSSSSSLTFSLYGRRVSPLVHGLHGVGGVRAPLRLDLFLSISAFLDSGLSPFLIFSKIRNSDWIETLNTNFLWILAFCSERRSTTALWGVHEGQGCPHPWGAPPASWATRASSCVDSSSQKS